jgi:dimeric dUTPase (all-alpha-NTP-PPase superfamily)
MHQLDSKEGITEWFNEYLSLGHSLGFSFKEISEAYFKKNQINFKRQNENY